MNRRTTYTYDDRGNRLTKESDWDADGRVETRITYSYDDKNNMVLWVRGRDGEVYDRWTFTYDCWN